MMDLSVRRPCHVLLLLGNELLTSIILYLLNNHRTLKISILIVWVPIVWAHGMLRLYWRVAWRLRPVQETNKIIVSHVLHGSEILETIFLPINFMLLLDNINKFVVVYEAVRLLMRGVFTSQITLLGCNYLRLYALIGLLPGFVFLPIFVADFIYLSDGLRNGIMACSLVDQVFEAAAMITISICLSPILNTWTKLSKDFFVLASFMLIHGSIRIRCIP